MHAQGCKHTNEADNRREHSILTHGNEGTFMSVAANSGRRVHFTITVHFISADWNIQLMLKSSDNQGMGVGGGHRNLNSPWLKAGQLEPENVPWHV